MRRDSASHLDIAALAESQHGVVARSQLLALGLTVAAIDHRVRAGQLRRMHHGVYAVGHRVLTADGRRLAAVLAAGAGAVLSHGSAAAAWELRPPSSGLIHITVPGHAGRERRVGLKVHRSVTLRPGDVTHHRGIPITTPARTIIDLSRTLKGRPLEHVVDLADQRGLIDFADLRRANSASLQAVLQRYTAAPTRSELEERFLALCDDHGLPRPETNKRIEGIEVDFVWRDARLIVEVDGYRYHRSPSAFEADRERDVTLTAANWVVLRFTWRQITRRRGWVATAVGGRLAG
jgi:very-short-patch-repair endonuclease/predicted transcriptional regulator of viral defense system